MTRRRRQRKTTRTKSRNLRRRKRLRTPKLNTTNRAKKETKKQTTAKHNKRSRKAKNPKNETKPKPNHIPVYTKKRGYFPFFLYINIPVLVLVQCSVWVFGCSASINCFDVVWFFGSYIPIGVVFWRNVPLIPYCFCFEFLWSILPRFLSYSVFNSVCFLVLLFLVF